LLILGLLIEDMQKNKIYFASDFHLGLDTPYSSSVQREIKIVRWLEYIKEDAKALYLVGDIFDYWFEYKNTVPKGFIRFFGKLAELRDLGIEIHFFTGNHDMWMFQYLTDELGVEIHSQPIVYQCDGKTFFIGHGDGLGPGDLGYKFIKTMFSNKINQRLFSLVHPTFAIKIMKSISKKVRLYPGDEEPFGSPKKEYLIAFSEKESMVQDIDYFVFGHRHLPIDYTLSNGKSRYINLGEWMYASSYGVWDGANIELQFFESEYTNIFGL
jgi:UDP-2,3-diacylglucosamine hydrolase